MQIYSPNTEKPQTEGILYPGFATSESSVVREIRSRNIELFELQVGDLITISNVHGGESALLGAINKNGQNAINDLNLTELQPFTDSLDCLNEHTLLRDISRMTLYRVFDAETPAGERFIFKASAPCTLLVGAPVEPNMISNGGGNTLLAQISSTENSSQTQLPEALAQIRDEFRVPRATAKSYVVKKGEYIQIIDVKGRQCSDFIAFPQAAIDEGIERFIDSTVTRTMVGSAYPQPGLFDKFYDQDMQPLVAVIQDSVGRHDTFGLACTARGYEERGFPGHINCSDNISAAIKPFGIKPRRAWPAINLFFNSWITLENNQLSKDESWSRPGDSVVMQALTDLVCVSTACPDDIDPINGWNPTDIHVRLYAAGATIEKAIAHRPFTESEPIMTEHSAFHPRTSELTQSFHIARDLWLPYNYESTRALEEYWACRESVTLQDMSSLRKFDIMGPDAQKLLQICMTKNIAKLSVNRGLYGLILSDTGMVIDDGTLFRLAPELFRWCCGSDESGKQLRQIAEQFNLKVWVKSLWSAMPNLALQGPASRDLLKRIVHTDVHQPSLDNVKWFGFTIARLNNREGHPFMLTRTGFTGELGYEIFCNHGEALAIWDSIMEAGAEFDIKPMGGEALSIVRIEAGLMVAGAEFGPDIDALEAGLGFAVDLDKEDFVGKEALVRNTAAPRRKLVGLLLSAMECPEHGDPIFSGSHQVGVITSAAYSPTLERPIAMARVSVEHSAENTALEVGRLDGRMKRLTATVTSIPFVDPQRKRARA